MKGEAILLVIDPSVFDGTNYQKWAIRTETYLEALYLWEAVEEDYEISFLLENPTIAHINVQKERKIEKSKANECLFTTISLTISHKSSQ